MPFPGRVRLAIEFVQRLTAPRTVRIRDQELAGPQIEGHGVGGVGLQLDGVRARPSRRVDDRQGTIERAVVIAGHLGNHEWRMRGPDREISDPEPCAGGLRHRCALQTMRLASPR